MEREKIRFELASSVVLDGSVVIKWFRKYETLYDQAIRLRQEYLDGKLFIIVPDILVYEIANVLRYKPDMNQSKVQQAIQSLFDMGIEIQFVSPDIVLRSITIAYIYDVTVYDAIFVTLAERLEVDFITVDEKLIQKLDKFPNIYHLTEWHKRL